MIPLNEAEVSIRTSKEEMNVEMIYDFLHHRSYWAKGIPRKIVQKSIENSICFGVFTGQQQVGFARVISDKATFAYLADVFILEPYRGQGLSKKMIENILTHPELQGLRRWILATADAHDLYRQNGFSGLAKPERWMEKHFPEVYRSSN